MPKLRVSIQDPKIEEIMELLDSNNVNCDIGSNGVFIDASNPKNNEVVAAIMSMAEDYTLS